MRLTKQKWGWLRLTLVAITLVFAGLAIVNATFWGIDREYHQLWMLLSRARSLAMMSGPITVRFSGNTAFVENSDGSSIESLSMATLSEVRFKTTQGDRRIVFGSGGQTNSYNIYLHGGDITLRSWTGKSRSIWIHCTGGMTSGQNNDWSLNQR